MPIDTSILGGITLPQLRDPQQEAINRFNLQTAQLEQQQLQQRIQTERENAAQAKQLNEAMNQAWGFVSQYMDPSTGMIPTEKFGEIIHQSGIPSKYASNVINMMKTINTDVMAQRKNEIDWQKVQSELEDAQKKREANTMATLADQVLAIDDPVVQNITFLANLGRLVSNGKVSKNDSQQILSSISNPDGSINPDRMTSVLESVVRMDEKVAAARQAAHKPVTYGTTGEWAMVDGHPMFIRSSSQGRMIDQYGNVVTGEIKPMPEKPKPETQGGYTWARDPKTGQVRMMRESEAAQIGAGQPDTAQMRSKLDAAKATDRAVDQVKRLSQNVINKIGPQQRAQALKRGAQAVFGNDPEFRTYQDARTAFAAMLAVEQQGSRPSDADVKSAWLPMVPDVYSDTQESSELKWDLIDAMRGKEKQKAPVPQNVTNALKGKTSGTYKLNDGSVWVIEEDGTIRKGGL